MPWLPVLLPDDPAVLKAMVAALQAQNAQLSATVRVYDQLIQSLQLRIAKAQEAGVRQILARRSRARSSNWNWRSRGC